MQNQSQQRKKVYCTNCGSAILQDWKYCRNCGAPIDIAVLNEENLEPTERNTTTYETVTVQNKKSNSSRKGGWILFLSAIILLAAFVYATQFAPKGLTTRFAPNAPTPTLAPTPKPVYITNGRILKYPSYKRVCPLTVSVPKGDENYYLFLKYIKAPAKTTEARVKDGSNSESNMAFYVEAGKTVKVNVPIGVYKLYYACGDTWFGTAKRFGENTLYYTSDDYLEFYADSGYYHGHTLELWLQSNGNFERTKISESDFPE